MPGLAWRQQVWASVSSLGRASSVQSSDHMYGALTVRRTSDRTRDLFCNTMYSRLDQITMRNLQQRRQAIYSGISQEPSTTESQRAQRGVHEIQIVGKIDMKRRLFAFLLD